MAFDIANNIFNYTLSLDPNVFDYTINDYAPLQLTINPNITTDKKVRSIKYIWNDKEEMVIDYNPSLAYDNGNPINFLQSYNFFIEDKRINEKQYKIKVIFYFFTDSNHLDFNIILNLKKPSLNNFFEKINLLKTRMFGPNNTILYVFETKTPDYILMSTVNWEIVPEQIITEKLPPIRYYQFLPSFENSFSSFIPANSAIQNMLPKNNDIRMNNTYDNGGDQSTFIIASNGD